MPIFEIECPDCSFSGEVLMMNADGPMVCPGCGGPNAEKLISATSSLTGRPGLNMPGAQDTACCGNRPGEAAGCAGPGSCCGKN